MNSFRLICLAGILLIFYGMSRPNLSRIFEVENKNIEDHYDITFVSDDIVLLEDKFSDFERKFKIDSSPLEINQYMQYIDLINADPADYNPNFTFTDILLVSGTHGWYALNIGDIDHDGNLDFLGSYKVRYSVEIIDCAIVELQESGEFETQIVYRDRVTRGIAITDLDDDGLTEVILKMEYGDSLANYESRSPNAYPDSVNFTHPINRGTINNETVIDADGDSIMDIIYTGRDSEGEKMFVAEYDIDTNRFIQRFKYETEDPRHWGLSHGDYDDDGHLEFVTATIDGEVYIFENQGNDSYAFIHEDTVATDNAYLNCTTNDIDGNGKIEFFIGGTGYYDDIPGSPVYWFEAIGNNQYEKKYSFFLMGAGGIGITELYNYDINADGVDDLVFCFAYSIVILIWNNAGYFDLVYYALPDINEDEFRSVNVYDVYGTGKPELITSISNCAQCEPRLFSKIYRNNLITKIKPENPHHRPRNFRLYQNYPNPFNNSTKIKFTLPKADHVELKVYDILGKEVSTIISKKLKQGNHLYQFDGGDLASGIYYYQLNLGRHRITKKMIHIK